MRYFLLSLIFLFSSALLHSAEELKLADATGGAPLEVFLQASLELSMTGTLNVEMKRVLPDKALEKLAAGELDAVIIDRRFVKNMPYVPFAAEALALYVNRVNPARNVSKKAVWEILSSFRPSWKEYNNLDFDIQRVTMKPLSPTGTLIRRIFGNREIDDEILKVDSFSAGFAFSNSASLFFAQFIPLPPPEMKMLEVDGIMPSSGTVKSGEYPLSVNYVAVYRGEMPGGLKKLIGILSGEKYRRTMMDSGLLVLLPQPNGEEKK